MSDDWRQLVWAEIAGGRSHTPQLAQIHVVTILISTAVNGDVVHLAL